MNITYANIFDNMKVSHKIDTDIDPTIYKAHSHPYYELLFFLDGEIEYVVENERFILKKNTGVLIKPTQYHYANVLGQKTYDRYVLKFDASALSSNMQSVVSNLGGKGSFSLNNASALSLFDKLDYYSTKYSNEDLHDIYTSTITELLLEISTYFDKSQAIVVNKKMTEILSYINNNLSDKITLDSLCKQFYQSKTWLYHAFMESVHVSPIKYIEAKRLAFANDLINSGMRPTKIFALCGYSDYSAFYRAYTSFYKRPPTATKNKHQKKTKKKTTTLKTDKEQ